MLMMECKSALLNKLARFAVLCNDIVWMRILRSPAELVYLVVKKVHSDCCMCCVVGGGVGVGGQGHTTEQFEGQQGCCR